MGAKEGRETSLRERVYRDLRRDLMAGTYPPTERLGEERLAEHYAVSRTPVREALARLQADGLVERGDTGLYPYRPRLGALADYYELRITLEVRGIQRVVDDPDLRHDRAVLLPELERWSALRSDPPDPDAGFVISDEQFHVVVIQSAGNDALVEALAAVNARIRPVRMFDYLTRDRMKATIEEHIGIAQALLDGELPRAERLLLDHIDESRRTVVERAHQVVDLAPMTRALK